MKKLFLLFLLFNLKAYIFAEDSGTVLISDEKQKLDFINEKAEVEGIFNEEYLPRVEELLNNAKESICFVQFEFHPDTTTEKIRRILYKKRKEGIKIRGLVESSLDFNKKAVEEFGKENIEVKLGSPKKYIHCKMFIVDNELVLLGSTNLSWAAILRNNETNVLLKSKTLAKYYTDYFEKVWKSPKKDAELTMIELPNTIPVVDRQLYDLLTEKIGSAGKRIWILLYGVRIHSKDDEVAQLLRKIAKKKKENVEVRLILEKSDYNERLNNYNNEVIKFLKELDLEVQFDSEEKITHAKMCIIDDMVLIGSANWAYGGFFLYHEALCFVKDGKLLAKSMKYFDDIIK